MNAGRLALRRALRTHTVREIARGIACSHAAVVQWANNDRRVPSYRNRTRLQALLGIDPESWERPASALVNLVSSERERLEA